MASSPETWNMAMPGLDMSTAGNHIAPHSK